MTSPEAQPKVPDLAAPEVSACPYAYYDKAREAAAAYPVPTMNGYLVTRYDDVALVTRDYKSFSSRRLPLGAGDPEIQAIVAEGYPQVPALVSCDPPQHTRYRKLVNGPFLASAVNRHEALIRQTVTELIDGFIGQGTVELSTQFAIPFTTRVIGSILGVPDSALKNFGRWADLIAESVSGYLPRDRQLECARGIVEMQQFFAGLIEERRAEPGDDLVSAMITARAEDEQPLEITEMLELIRIFVAGGTETTASLICSAVYLLLHHPTQFAEVRADPGLIPPMLEEALRFDSPGQWNPRMIFDDGVELHGTPIPKGARIMIAWAAANRDPAKFGPDADQFDIHRPDAQKHVGFGLGAHYCVGASLARLEARIACEQLFARLADLRFAVPEDEITYVGKGVVRGLSALPLAFTPVAGH